MEKEPTRYTTTEELKDLARSVAAHHGLNEERFLGVIKCESRWDPDTQSEIPAKGPNGREDSWGLAQIHLPSHPSVSREQAQDPVFALNWMADKWSEGKHRLWSCHKKLYPNG
jgi:hypothetical protein